MVKKIAILGSTGSIGQSTLAVCREHKDNFQIEALAAGKNLKLLHEQIQEFLPKMVSVSSKDDAEKLKSQISQNIDVVYGDEGLLKIAGENDSDLVVSAIVGAQGLAPTLKAIESQKNIALANKESMIIAGEIMSKRAREQNIQIIPIDSEHSAIFQCLQGEDFENVAKLILTASGGPFLETPLEDFKNLNVAQALNHPNWSMGEKITIDSATMMNKGLEVIEAHYLFGMPIQNIEVVIHPQSLIHSLVEFHDGAVMAQMGCPDMRQPIAYALSYPNRVKLDVPRLNLAKAKELTFFAPDFAKFKSLKMAYDVAKKGKSWIPVLNAANEVAVYAFLAKKIGFSDIPELIENCLNDHQDFEIHEIDDVLAADRWARKKTSFDVERLQQKR